MLVFTDKWIDELRHKWDNRPRYEKPYHYFLALEDYYLPLRSEVEEWITSIPENKLNNVVSRLRGDDHFIQTYNELAVGAYLNNLGFQLEYEPSETVLDKKYSVI